MVALRIITALLIISAALLYLLWMPGHSYRGALPVRRPETAMLASRLQEIVQRLAADIGPRSLVNYDSLVQAAEYIEEQLAAAGCRLRRQQVASPYGREESWNIEASVEGTAGDRRVLVIGAHYDAVAPDCPGANDNASGVAAMIALAERLAKLEPSCTLRFVAFSNEEPPYFMTPHMGSSVYAKEARNRGENIIGMFSLETIGYYSEEPSSQQYPVKALSWIYPDTGNFIGFVSTLGSVRLLRTSIKVFRKHGLIASEGISAPAFVPGVAWSDHWSFSQAGFPAVMITDTAPFRYPEYHQHDDTWEKLNYPAMAEVVLGMEEVIKELCK